MSSPSASALTTRRASAACGPSSTRGTRCARRPARVLPMTVPMLMPNAAAGGRVACTSMRAPTPAPSPRACASSTESIVNAVRAPAAGSRRRGRSRAARSRPSTRSRRVVRVDAGALQAQRHARDRLAPVQRQPRRLRAWAKAPARSMLETEEHAKRARSEDLRRARGRRRGHRRLVPHHRSTTRGPRRRGPCASRCDAAGALLDDVTHINAHATSTPVGDLAEYQALLRGVRRAGPRDPGVGDEGVHGTPARRHGRAGGASSRSSRLPRPRRAADDQHHRAGPGGAARTCQGSPRAAR